MIFSNTEEIVEFAEFKANENTIPKIFLMLLKNFAIVYRDISLITEEYSSYDDEIERTRDLQTTEIIEYVFKQTISYLEDLNTYSKFQKNSFLDNSTRKLDLNEYIKLFAEAKIGG